jgi:hypothetical protein
MSEETKAPELTKDQKLALFAEYERAHAKVTAAHAQATAAQVEVSAAVKKISAACGSGPFKWKGQELQVVKLRKSEGVTFRRSGERSVEEIG